MNAFRDQSDIAQIDSRAPNQRDRWRHWQSIASTGSIAQTIFTPRTVSRFSARLPFSALIQLENLVKDADISIIRGISDDYAVIPTWRLPDLIGERND